METAADSYVIACHKCLVPFDALQASWCSCLVTERSFVCASCGACFCKAPAAFKQRFWSGAPKAVWDKKLEEKREEFQPSRNPTPRDAVRPLVLLVEDERVIQLVAIRVMGLYHRFIEPD